jgi:predicted ATPase
MPEVGKTYDRGLLLSRRSGDHKHLFSLLSGAWLFHIVRGELEESRRLAQACVDNARREGVPAQQMAGRFLLGTSLFHLGQLAASWEQIDQVASSDDGPSHPALALFAGPDVGVFRRAYVSHLLCQFGHAERAVAKSDESIARARDVSHPFTLGIALIIRQCCTFTDGRASLPWLAPMKHPQSVESTDSYIIWLWPR